MAEQFLDYCKTHSKLHRGEIGAQKKRSAIDVVAALVYTVQENWEEKARQLYNLWM